jgi:hypothetical protein
MCDGNERQLWSIHQQTSMLFLNIIAGGLESPDLPAIEKEGSLW